MIWTKSIYKFYIHCKHHNIPQCFLWLGSMNGKGNLYFDSSVNCMKGYQFHMSETTGSSKVILSIIIIIIYAAPVMAVHIIII